MASSSVPRILPAPSRPMESPPSSDPNFSQTTTAKRKTDLASASAVKKRARVSYSCQECHRRKQKCDRQIPCGHCVARKVPELCKNYQPGKAEDFNARLSRIEQIIDTHFPQYANGEDIPGSPREAGGSLSATIPSSGLWSLPSNGPLIEMDRQDIDMIQKSSPSSRSVSPKPEGFDPSGGMLEAGRWYGTSALASVNSRPIIDQLQNSTAGNIPSAVDEPSGVTDKLKSLIQDYGVAPHKLSELVQELPPKSLSDVLIDFYFTSVNYTRYPLYEPSFRASYESICTNGVRVQPNDIRFLPLLFVVLAIAARLAPEHILGDDRHKRVTSLRYYWSSRRSILIVAAVQTDCVETILTRLLSVRFLTFDRRITECWAQLGAAVRTAQAIGLHRDPGKMGLDPFTTEFRRRVWAYLYHADATFALLLGRPRAIHDMYCDTHSPLNIDDDELVDHIRKLGQIVAPGTQSLPQLQGHPLSQPTYQTFVILRHQLAGIMGHIVHHFQQVRHPHYAEVVALEEELQRFIKALPPHYGLEPDTSLDERYPFVPVHRFLIVTEVFFVRISLHRPYILRRLDSDRFAASRRACFESAMKDFAIRRNFRQTMPQATLDALGGAYREFQSAMISGIALIIDPHGPDSAAMHDILDTFLRDHGIGDGAGPVLKELDETTKRELKIIEFLSQKAKSAEARVVKKKEGEEEDEEETEEGSARPKRKKSSRSVTSTDAGLLLGISGQTGPLGSSASTAVGTSAATSPFTHNRTPSNLNIPRPGVNSPLTRTPIDSPSPKFTAHPNMSPSHTRLNPPSHVASPRLVDLAQRQPHESMSLASSSPSAEEEHAQTLLDNWCNNVNSTGLEPTPGSMGGFDSNLFSVFGQSGIPGGPMWGGPLVSTPGFQQGLGLGLMTTSVPTATTDPNTAPAANGLPSAELGPLSGDGADYMYWDNLVQQIRGGVS